jgi:Ca2+-binding RTX toxin-like protein
MSDSFNGSNALAEIIRDDVIGAFQGATVGATGFTDVPGQPLPPPASGRGYVAFITPVSGSLALPADYPVVFDNQAGPLSLAAGGEAGQVVVAFGGLTYDVAGGSAAIYTGEPVSGPGAGDTIFLNGASPSYVAAGEGSDTVVAAGGNHVIALGSGANTAFLATGSDILASEGNDVVVMGSGTATVSLSGSSDVFGGAGKMLLQFGAGFGQLFQGAGAVTVFGGTGGGMFAGGTAGGNVLVAGTGATTLFGGGANDLLFAGGAANDVLVASAGNSTLFGAGASGNDTFVAGSGAAFITGGGGADLFFAGTGAATMAAGTGPDVFAFAASHAGGTDVIEGFKVGVDQVALSGYDPGNVGTAAQQALADAAANSAGGSTFVTLSDHTTIVFAGTTQLAANSFVG